MESFLEDMPRGFLICIAVIIFVGIITSGFVLERFVRSSALLFFGIAVILAALGILCFAYSSRAWEA